MQLNEHFSDPPDLAASDVASASKAPPVPPIPNRAADDVRPTVLPPNIGAASIVPPVAVIPTKAPPRVLIPSCFCLAPYTPDMVHPNVAPPNMVYPNVLPKNLPPIPNVLPSNVQIIAILACYS